jgi:hypothetical protein
MARQKQERKPKARRQKGTGCVIRPDNSRFWVSIVYYNGKPSKQSTATTNRREAESIHQKRLAEIATGTFLGPEAERVRVEDLAEDFLRDYRINGRKSVDDVETRWRLHLKPFFGVL